MASECCVLPSGMALPSSPPACLCNMPSRCCLPRPLIRTSLPRGAGRAGRRASLPGKRRQWTESPASAMPTRPQEGASLPQPLTLHRAQTRWCGGRGDPSAIPIHCDCLCHLTYWAILLEVTCLHPHPPVNPCRWRLFPSPLSSGHLRRQGTVPGHPLSTAPCPSAPCWRCV